MKRLLFTTAAFFLFLFPIQSGSGQKYYGEKFIFEHISRQSDDFIEKIIEFEAKYADDLGNYTADLVLRGNRKLEYKSWSESFTKNYLKGKQATDQLKHYIKDGNFEYIFNKQKLLKSVADPDKFVKGEFQKVFRENAEELFNQNPTFFKQMNKVGGGKIETVSQFRQLINDNSFIDQLSTFIKIQ